MISVGFNFIQEQQFGELEKNSDKQLTGDSQGQMDAPSHFHQLLSGLHKHLLAHCYVSSNYEVKQGTLPREFKPNILPGCCCI